MLQLFGFPYLTAPGEAEAECALLQSKGIVDAVMTEDIDCLMFGCGITLRNWSSEGIRGNRAPTHVSVYRAAGIKLGRSGLDKDGMVLVALMSGGDYVPAGIPKCGIVIACEAARAGFGKDLCKIGKDDKIGFKQWRERLAYELRTNESNYFRTKHPALTVPEAFPNSKVLGYYIHPVVSSTEKIADIRMNIQWTGSPDIEGLRKFVADAFDWNYLGGAFNFIRGIAPALLMQRLQLRAQDSSLRPEIIEEREKEESQYVKAILNRRIHSSTGGAPELRVVFIPATIVPLNLENEETDAYAGITADDSEEEAIEVAVDSSGDDRCRSTSPRKKRAGSKYDPSVPEKTWILETVVRLGVPLTVKTWEADMKIPKKVATRKNRDKEVMARGGMRVGAIEAFVRVTKPGVGRGPHGRRLGDVVETDALGTRKLRTVDNVALRSLPTLPTCSSTQTANNVPGSPDDRRTSEALGQKKRAPRAGRQPAVTSSPIDSNTNPWSLARRPADTLDLDPRSIKKYSALGINVSSPIQVRACPSYRPDSRDASDSEPRPPSPLLGRKSKHPAKTTAPGPRPPRPTQTAPEVIEIPSSPPTIAPRTRQRSLEAESDLESDPDSDPDSNTSTHPYPHSLPLPRPLPYTSQPHPTHLTTTTNPTSTPLSTRSPNIHTLPPSPSPSPFPSSPLPTLTQLLPSPNRTHPPPHHPGTAPPAPPPTTVVSTTVPMAETTPGQEPSRAGEKHVVLRSSLVGAWKEVKGWEVEVEVEMGVRMVGRGKAGRGRGRELGGERETGRGRRVFMGLEVVDLTGG